MSVHEEFGEVRELLEREPSEAIFDVVTQRLEAAAAQDDAQVRQSLLPYAEAKLERWPDALRLCPRHQLEHYESGRPIWCHLVRALDYEGVSIKKSRLDKILTAPNASQVKHLDIRSANLKWDQIGKLVDEAPFELESFGFRRVSDIDWDVLDALFSSKMLAGVKRLNFRGWDKIKADVYAHLIAHFPLENLRALDVSGGAMSARKLKELLSTKRIDKLEEFRAGAWVSDKTTGGMIHELARHDALHDLRVLEVNDFKAGELDLLAHAEHLSSLRVLHLGWPQAQTQYDAMFESPHLADLEDLSLDVDAERWTELFGVLTDAPLLDGLKSLRLTGYDVACEPDVFARFLTSGRLESLRRLSMPFTPDMLRLLREHASALPGLEQLHLGVCGSAEESRGHLDALFSEVHFPELRTLKLASSSGDVSENEQSMRIMLDAIHDTAQLSMIETLRVLDARATDLAQFLGRASLARLRTLDISNYYYGRVEPIFSALLDAEHFGSVESIMVDARYRMNALLEQMKATSHHLPEFLHIGYPEYAQLQMDDWM